MENQQKLNLFGTIQIEQNTKIIDDLLLNMSVEQAIFLLTESLKYAYQKNVFTLLESEIISRSIRKIYEVKPEQKMEE